MLLRKYLLQNALKIVHDTTAIATTTTTTTTCGGYRNRGGEGGERRYINRGKNVRGYLSVTTKI